MKIQKQISKSIEDTQAIIQVVKNSCAFCGNFEGSIPIVDSETEQEILICEICDNDLDFKNELTAEQEDYMLESQLEYLREQRQ